MAGYWVVFSELALLMVLGQSGVETNVIDKFEQDCTTHDNCSSEEMCVNNTCVDPCSAANCGDNSECQGHNHMSMCFCSPGYTFVLHTGCVFNDKESYYKNCYCVDDNTSITGVTDIEDENSDLSIGFHQNSCFCAKGNPTAGSAITDTAKIDYPITPQQVKPKKMFLLYDDTEMTWNQSLAHCSALNMTLATINSQEEQDRLYNMIQGYTWWIGGSDFEDPGNYRWAPTSKPITYSNWWPGQPNSRIRYTGEVQHCMHIGGHTGQWYDYYCSDRNYHVCEYYS